MKKALWLGLALLVFSCAKEKPDYTIISGIMKNTDGDRFTLTGLSFQKNINVKPDGTFRDTLHLEYEGLYKIGEQRLYLEKGKDIKFEADAELIENIVFSGDLAVENNFFTKESLIVSEILGTTRDLYTLDEPGFLAKIDKLGEKRNQLIESTNFSAKGFKDKALKSVNYHKNFLLESYVMYHGFLIGDPSFVVSTSFPKIDDTIDYDNSEDYNFSSAYRNLVENNFADKVQKAVSEGTENYYQTQLATFKAIRSQNIKNDLAKTLAYSISPSNPELDAFYDALFASVTDQIFKEELTQRYDKIKTLTKGKQSPKFIGYENYNGGTTSLDDLKGKYVYIDVWATWCGPCKQEMPFLKEAEKKYHDKNIAFVSISIDQKKDQDVWRKFIEKEQLSGIQLLADNDSQSQFVKDYVIDGIPRFILLDTEGKILSADAPRPSDTEAFAKMFAELGI